MHAIGGEGEEGQERGIRLWGERGRGKGEEKWEEGGKVVERAKGEGRREKMKEKEYESWGGRWEKVKRGKGECQVLCIHSSKQ